MAELKEGDLIKLRTGTLAIVGYIQHDTGVVFIRELSIRGNTIIECDRYGRDSAGQKVAFLQEEWKKLPISSMSERDDFYPGCPVLVQCYDHIAGKRIWRMAHLSHITKEGVFVLTHGSIRKRGEPILPYHGNECLLGMGVDCDL